jgi:hypothetical protein
VGTARVVSALANIDRGLAFAVATEEAEPEAEADDET